MQGSGALGDGVYPHTESRVSRSPTVPRHGTSPGQCTNSHAYTVRPEQPHTAQPSPCIQRESSACASLSTQALQPGVWTLTLNSTPET